MNLTSLLLPMSIVVLACETKPATSPEGAQPSTPTTASVTTSPSKGTTCGPAQATFSIPSCCGGDLRYFWNGTACVTDAAKCGCSCSGRDCDRFFVAKMQCEQAYATCK